MQLRENFFPAFLWVPEDLSAKGLVYETRKGRVYLMPQFNRVARLEGIRGLSWKSG